MERYVNAFRVGMFECTVHFLDPLRGPERIPASRPWVKEGDEYAFYFESDSGPEDRTAFLFSEVGAIKPTKRSQSRWTPCNPSGISCVYGE